MYYISCNYVSFCRLCLYRTVLTFLSSFPSRWEVWLGNRYSSEHTKWLFQNKSHCINSISRFCHGEGRAGKLVSLSDQTGGALSGFLSFAVCFSITLQPFISFFLNYCYISVYFFFYISLSFSFFISLSPLSSLPPLCPHPTSTLQSQTQRGPSGREQMTVLIGSPSHVSAS